MLRSSGRLRLAAVLALGWAIAWPAAAALCLTDADCATTPLGGIRDCVKSKVFGFELPFGSCARAGVCNSDRDCVPGAVCELGTCQRPGDAPAGSGGGTPSGSGTPGEGRHCMPAEGSRPADWAKDKSGKALGACPQGTRCNEHGFCVRLET